MRTALIGLGMILMGVIALYQMRNGALLYVYQQIYYAPPNVEALAPEFAALAEAPSKTAGATFGDVAAARLSCAEDLLGARPPLEGAVAFQRVNLILLGAGLGLTAPVIDPTTHYVLELRGDLGRDAGVFRTTPLSEKKQATFISRLDQLTDISHPLFDDLRLTIPQHRQGLMVLAEALVSGGLPYHECVNDRTL